MPRTALAALIAAAAISGCAATPPPTAASTATITMTTTASSASHAPAARIAVPDEVGKDYQTAQDAWRAAGLHVAPAEDATGAHRLPLVDANWVVVSQDPAAGARVERGEFITATVKKYTDG